ncbi:cupin domain-containing protein [Robiginitalea aurantiaca]|uniref:Cupin domain-containing protein n=1 Tax=Robiginitalea aurantiaca TaxID=3056915 RepID=A0ABT7WHB9_9FLAO|nr:cupin domain-containing protein [Robiginitalea aurantiaca]MDM9632314.1 cupin domain-containing protein [Robiginitalea aurantiaca]
MDYSLNTIPAREIIPGFRGKLVHGAEMSLVFWEVDSGSEVPEHHHKNEQIMHVIEGRFEFTLNGVTREYTPGDIVLIPANVPHSGKALEACRLMDVFSPVREEYR